MSAVPTTALAGSQLKRCPGADVALFSDFTGDD